MKEMSWMKVYIVCITVGQTVTKTKLKRFLTLCMTYIGDCGRENERSREADEPLRANFFFLHKKGCTLIFNNQQIEHVKFHKFFMFDVMFD